VVVVIPIGDRNANGGVFVPHDALIPAAFTRFTQLVTSMFRFGGYSAVMFRGFVKLVVRLGDSSLTTIVVLGRCAGRSREC